MHRTARRAAPAATVVPPVLPSTSTPATPARAEAAPGPAQAPVAAGRSASRARGLYTLGDGPNRRIRVHHLREMKARGQRLSAITCYDATFARLVDAAGVEVVLVGDSLGNVIQGHDTTLPVTVDHVVYHSAAVSRGLQHAHLVADMPFMSYRNVDVALHNAGRLLAEGGAHAVKLEGGVEVVAIVRALVAAGIPVMGHIGLTPQSVHAMGGHRVQGRGQVARDRLLEAARALEEAGCYALVLEAIPAELAQEITDALQIPTIGIGAGPGCDGQILVLYDLLGLNPGFRPKFLKQYAALGTAITDALSAYRDEVQTGAFPSHEHAYADPTLVPAEPIAAPAGP